VSGQSWDNNFSKVLLGITNSYNAAGTIWQCLPNEKTYLPFTQKSHSKNSSEMDALASVGNEVQ